MVTSIPTQLPTEKQFDIRHNDRCFFVGVTGSGKTTLAKSLLWNKAAIYVCDPKHTFSVPEVWPLGYIITSDVGEVTAHNTAETVIYRPDLDALDKQCDPFFQTLFFKGNCIIYIDEVMSIAPTGKAGYWTRQNIQLGRERHIGVWSATQRPVSVPLICLSESQNFFCFELNHPDDRKRMADYTDPALLKPVRNEFGFYYFNQRQKKVRYYPKANVGVLQNG